jgi:hypothetical protein
VIKLEPNSMSSKYSKSYIQATFGLWYNNGRPGIRKLISMIVEPDPLNNSIPTYQTVSIWMKDYNWIELADELDLDARNQIQDHLVANKVEMLKRHAHVAREMQDVALEYLRENGVGGSRNAIELLVKGMAIEKESSGVTQAVTKIADLSDEELLKQLTETITRGKIEPISDDEFEE